MSKRLSSDVEQDERATTAQAVWALITGQRDQIDGLAAATSGSVADQIDFFKTARLVSKASRLAIDSQTVRVPIVISEWNGTFTNRCTIARVSRLLAAQLADDALLPHYGAVDTPSIVQLITSYAARRGTGTLWVASTDRVTTYNFVDGKVIRFIGYSRKFGLHVLNNDRALFPPQIRNARSAT